MYIMPYPQADQENTTDFLDELRYRYPKDAKLTICWDNARWHRSHAVRSYLAERNDGVAQTEWSVTVLHFAPHDSTQNPIEAVWRQGKMALRRQRLTAPSFSQVTEAFEVSLEQHVFDFPKRLLYGDLRIR